MLGPLSGPGLHLAGLGCTIVAVALPERLKGDRLEGTGWIGRDARATALSVCAWVLATAAGQVLLSDLALTSERASGRMMPGGKRGTREGDDGADFQKSQQPPSGWP